MYFKRSLILLAMAWSVNVNVSQAQQKDSVVFKRYRAADFRTWSVGFNAGLVSPRAALSMANGVYNTTLVSYGFGMYLKKQLSPDVGLQLDLFKGRARQKDFSYNGVAAPEGRSYTDIQWNVGLSAVYDITRIYFNDTWGVIIPYVKGGVGYLSWNTKTENVPGGISDATMKDWTIPISAAVKVALSKGINLDLGYDVNFVRSKLFDGFFTSRNDRWAYVHAGVEIALGKKKKMQLQSYDQFVGVVKLNTALNSRLDSAEQNVVNITNQYQLDLADDDNDGVPNKFDKCPGTPAGTVVDGSGCPLSTVACRVLKEAYENLEFEFGKAVIKESSFASLDNLVKVLLEKDFSLKIAGHTDIIGSRLFNYKLSKERAEAVKAYVVSKGGNPSRIEAIGFGPDQPIASNSTEEGRKRNRRVEFTFF